MYSNADLKLLQRYINSAYYENNNSGPLRPQRPSAAHVFEKSGRSPPRMRMSCLTSIGWFQTPEPIDILYNLLFLPVLLLYLVMT